MSKIYWFLREATFANRWKPPVPRRSLVLEDNTRVRHAFAGTDQPECPNWWMYCPSSCSDAGRPSDTYSVDKDGSSDDAKFSSSPGEVQGLPCPGGTNRVLENWRQVTALQKGVQAIEKISGTMQRSSKISEELLNVDPEMSMISLFSMSGTNPSMKARFMKLAQRRAIDSLEQNCQESSSDTSQLPITVAQHMLRTKENRPENIVSHINSSSPSYKHQDSPPSPTIAPNLIPISADISPLLNSDD